MTNHLGLKYNIGDRIHANCYTDHNFSLKVQISAIANFDLAERYESVMLKMFNSDNAQELYDKFKNSTLYFYICEVLDMTEDYNAGDVIVLTDQLIKDQGTYYLNQELSMYVNVSFSTITNYRSKEEVMNDIKYYLTTKGVTSVDIKEEISYEDKLEYELNEYRSIVTSLKGLKSIEQLVDKLNTVTTTLINKIQDLLSSFKK